MSTWKKLNGSSAKVCEGKMTKTEQKAIGKAWIDEKGKESPAAKKQAEKTAEKVYNRGCSLGATKKRKSTKKRK